MIFPRETIGDVPPGIDVIIAFEGNSTLPPPDWAALRPTVERAVMRRGCGRLDWISKSFVLDGKPSHCMAFVNVPPHNPR